MGKEVVDEAAKGAHLDLLQAQTLRGCEGSLERGGAQVSQQRVQRLAVHQDVVCVKVAVNDTSSAGPR